MATVLRFCVPVRLLTESPAYIRGLLCSGRPAQPLCRQGRISFAPANRGPINVDTHLESRTSSPSERMMCSSTILAPTPTEALRLGFKHARIRFKHTRLSTCVLRSGLKRKGRFQHKRLKHVQCKHTRLKHAPFKTVGSVWDFGAWGFKGSVLHVLSGFWFRVFMASGFLRLQVFQCVRFSFRVCRGLRVRAVAVLGLVKASGVCDCYGSWSRSYGLRYHCWAHSCTVQGISPGLGFYEFSLFWVWIFSGFRPSGL